LCRTTYLAGGEGVRVESWQDEVLAGEVRDWNILEVRIVDSCLARDEPRPTGASRLQQTISAVPDGRRHGHLPEMWQFYTLDVRGKFVAKKAAGREPWSQASTYDTPPRAGKQATAGMLSTARIPAATGTPALRKGQQQNPDLSGSLKKWQERKPEIWL